MFFVWIFVLLSRLVSCLVNVCVCVKMSFLLGLEVSLINICCLLCWLSSRIW